MIHDFIIADKCPANKYIFSVLIKSKAARFIQ